MKISFAIMAHPAREPFVEELLGQIPRAPVTYDDTGDRWGNGRRALLAHPRNADWHVVIQDDALVCRDFYARMRPYLRKLEDRAMQLYIGKSRARMFRKHRGKPFVETGRLWWGVAIVLPTWRIDGMLKDTQSHEAEDAIAWGTRRSDSRIARYLRRQGLRVRYPLPSLVGHRDVPSIAKTKTKSLTRTAHFDWIDDE